MDIVKPQLDERHYETIELPNGLRAVIVSDPSRGRAEGPGSSSTPHKAAAALCIEVGSFSDPATCHGLSHYLEHVLFMGSTKFPDENDFDRFLKKHAGKTNAHTENEMTCFAFNVQWDHLYGALDRFSQFLSKPLLSQTALKRELQAVDSEFTANLQRDFPRKLQFISHIAREDHPLHQFGWGNLKSLKDLPEENGVDVATALRRHFSELYVASRMSLCVLGYQPMEELKKWIIGMFSDLPSVHSRNLYVDCGLPFSEEHWTKHFFLEPVHELTDVELLWQFAVVPGVRYMKAARMVATILAHQGPGSSFSLLKQKGWIASISASSTCETQRVSSFALFRINCKLTQKGLARIYDVVTIILRSLVLLKCSGFDQWRYEEMRRIFETKFRYHDVQDSFAYVKTLAMNLRNFPEHFVAAGPYHVTEEDKFAVQSLLASLRTDNFMLISRSKTYSELCNRQEPWFGTNYAQQTIPSSWLEKWRGLTVDMVSSAISLPFANPFLPAHFDLVDVRGFATPEPQIVIETPFARLWYKPNSEFRIPVSSIAINIVSPDSYSTLRNATLTELYLSLIKFSLEEYTYAAKVANLTYDIRASKTGVQVRLQGFSDKLVVLLCIVLDRFKQLNATELSFQVVLEQLIRNYENENLKPSDFALSLSRRSLCQREWLGLEVVEMLKTLSFQDFQVAMTSRRIVNPGTIEILVHGNHTRQEAETVFLLSSSSLMALSTSSQPAPAIRLAQVPYGAHALIRDNYNAEDKNSFVQTFFQIGGHDARQKAILEVIEHIMSEPYFQAMRTEQQLGYDVGCGFRLLHGHLGFVIFVQSPSAKFTVQEVDRRIDGFLQDFSKRLHDISQVDFEEAVQAIVTTKLAKNVNQHEEFDRLWAEIHSQCYSFNRSHKEVVLLRTLRRNDISLWFDEHISPSSPFRRKFSVFLVGNDKPPQVVQSVDPYPGLDYKPPTVLDRIDAFMNPPNWLPTGPDITINQDAATPSSFPCTVPNMHPHFAWANVI